MPRIYAGNGDPLDFCRSCWELLDEEIAENEFGVASTGSPPDNRTDGFGFDCPHPPYEECDYDCNDCGELLSDLDD